MSGFWERLATEYRSHGLFGLMKAYGWLAPAAASAVVAFFSLVAAIYSANAASKSADAASQSLTLQQTLYQQAIYDQRPKVTFLGGSISYVGTEEENRQGKFRYLLDLRFQNYGARSAKNFKTFAKLKDIGSFGVEATTSTPEIFSGSTGFTYRKEFRTDQLIGVGRLVFDNSEIGWLYFDDKPIGAPSAQQELTKGSICSGIEIWRLSILGPYRPLSGEHKFYIQAENRLSNEFEKSDPFGVGRDAWSDLSRVPCAK